MPTEESMYSKINKKVISIIEEAIKYMPNMNPEYIKAEINKAYLYARDAHEGQFRHSGDPYIIHPVEATKILLGLKPDIATIQACLMHDVIEDTPRNSDDIADVFSSEVSFLCEGMEKLSKLRYKGEERDIGSLRKMFIAMAEDLRIIFIKLADRTHNMKTLSFHPKKEKREKIALETLNIYAPIADRLGLYQLKNSLEEECFKILDKKAYKKLKKELKELGADRKQFETQAKKELKNILSSSGIKHYKVDIRVKSIYSIYKKLQKKGLDKASEIYDVFGMRIMVNSEEECYKILGLIHNTWSPIPNRFKDYIALPKPNGYRSIHTNVIGLLNEYRQQPTEIQIKTYDMKEFSDIGVAAHFEYKDKGSSKIARDIDWVKELKELTNSIQDTDFVGSLKVDVFRDRIFVFTPKGDAINLPAGSTPVDFAYYVHTELGDHITLSRVNGSVYPLDKELHNGDVVDIMTDKNKSPNPFWISFVKTVKAKQRIKLYLKKEDKELHRERGKEIMNRYLIKAGLSTFDKELSLIKNIEGVVLSLEDRWSLLEQVGNFSTTPSSIIKKILKNTKSLPKKEEKQKQKGIEKNTCSVKKTLIIGGEANMEYKLCYCSRRSLGKDIVAHINNKGQLTVHRRNCKILDTVNKQRLLSAYIAGDEEKYLQVRIGMVFKNRLGILKDLFEITSTMGIDIDEMSTKTLVKNQFYVDMVLLLLDYDYLLIDRFLERVNLHFKKEIIKIDTKK